MFGAIISIESSKTGVSTLSSKNNNSHSLVRLYNPNSCSNPSSKRGSGNKIGNSDDNNQRDLTSQISACDSHGDRDEKKNYYDDNAPPTHR